MRFGVPPMQTNCEKYSEENKIKFLYDFISDVYKAKRNSAAFVRYLCTNAQH